MTTYSRVGSTVAIVQTCAILEVVHVLLGWVRSPLQTTVMQVASRLWIVWGIVQQFDVVSAHRQFKVNVVSLISYPGTHKSAVHLGRFGLVLDRGRPLFILRQQSAGIRTSSPPISALHDVLCALPDRSGF
jgi:hypothetical protein